MRSLLSFSGALMMNLDARSSRTTRGNTWERTEEDMVGGDTDNKTWTV